MAIINSSSPSMEDRQRVRAHSQQERNDPIDIDAAVVVLVKFTVKRRGLIPPGIRQIERANDREMDTLHAEEAPNPALGKLGRLRKGRVDTGEQLICCRRPCQAAVLRLALANNGFRLRDVHYFIKDDKGDPQYVIVAGYYQPMPGEDLPPLSADTVEALRALSNMVWQYCYGWDNPSRRNVNHRVITLNFSGLLERANPKWALTTRDRLITAMPVDHKVDEAVEERLSAEPVATLGDLPEAQGLLKVIENK